MKLRSDKALEQTLSRAQAADVVLQIEILTDLSVVVILAEINLQCLNAIIRVPVDTRRSESPRCS